CRPPPARFVVGTGLARHAACRRRGNRGSGPPAAGRPACRTGQPRRRGQAPGRPRAGSRLTPTAGERPPATALPSATFGRPGNNWIGACPSTLPLARVTHKLLAEVQGERGA